MNVFGWPGEIHERIGWDEWMDLMLLESSSLLMKL